MGDKVREITSGFEGIVVGYSEYLWGCEQFLVTRRDERGLPESLWFDVARLKIVKRDALKPVRTEVPGTGPDVEAPIR